MPYCLNFGLTIMSFSDMNVTPETIHALETVEDAHSATSPVSATRGSGAPGPSRRLTVAQRARAATRAQLIASGQALFAERGLHRVTSHDIAAHAGVATGTFYNHFPDKAALFREITSEALAELERRLDVESLDHSGLPDAVRAHAEALVSFTEDHRELILILFSGDAEAAAVESDILEKLATSFASERREMISAGAMPASLDPDVLAQAIVGMWARVMAWWAEDPQRATRETVIDTLTNIQLGGTHPGLAAEVSPAERKTQPQD